MAFKAYANIARREAFPPIQRFTFPVDKYHFQLKNVFWCCGHSTLKGPILDMFLHIK